MASRRCRLSADEARRVALAAQGFDRSRPAAANDARHFRRALRSVGVLQLDFVNVLLPAHFLIIWSRLGDYDRARFEKFVYRSGEYTEQWAHEASIVDVRDWPLLGYRRRCHEPWKHSPLNTLENRESYLRDVLHQVRDRGALTSDQLPAVDGPSRKPGDWHRPIPRCALEYHFGRGGLAVRRRRPNFQRVYDLPERIIGADLLGRQVSKEDAQRELLRASACRLGIATLKDLADFYRLSPRDAAPRVRELEEEGHVTAVSVDGWKEPAYLSSSARSPRQIDGACLLSPFDPIVWFRPRALRLFGFEYRIEIYVPAPKRRWGYYVLPFRLGDRIVARVDLKADREEGRLLVRAAYAEPGIDPDHAIAELVAELHRLADWLGLDRVAVDANNDFAATLGRAARDY